MTTAWRLALAVALLCASQSVAAQDSLDRVRQQYAAAEYEAAMSSLDRLKAGGADAFEIDRYRALCLIGLGRAAEADQVMERIVNTDPLYQPDTRDISPAVRAAFTAVRRRVLPDIARRLFAEAKAAYDRKALPEAAEKFRLTLEVLDTPDLALEPDLNDLRLLTAGFCELTRDALPLPVKTTIASAEIAAASARPASPSPAPGRQPADPKPIRQDMPEWTFAIAAAHYDASYRATVDVEIDELGNVAGVEIIQSSHPGYNAVLIKTARGWKYEPTRRDGKPVQARKRVEVVLRPK
jgi:TonB family protein